MICLGVDVGSTSIKAGVLDLEQGVVRDVRQVPFPSPVAESNSDGRFEIEPSEIVDALHGLLGQMLKNAPRAEAIFCSGQMGGTILVDRDSGRPLTRYLSWRDQRMATSVDLLRTRLGQAWLAELGNELQAGSATSLLYWLRQQGQLAERAMPATVADFALAQLCDTCPQMHPTQAIGLLDLRSGDWHHDAFAVLGIDGLHWPRRAGESEPVGYLPHFDRRIPCYAAIGDQQAALRGAGLQRHELSLNISTGSQVSRRTSSFEPGPYQSRCYFGGDFLKTITHLPAGRSLNVLFDFVTEFAQSQNVPIGAAWKYITEQAAQADDSLEAELTFFAGPLGNSGSIRGITTENFTIGHVFRAAFRSMAENYHRCVQRLCPSLDGLSLALSGGLTRNVPLLRQMIQERFQLPMRESAGEEETLLGLLSVAREVYAA